MNLWVDVAIGNLLRQRPPPTDIVEDKELFACTKCGVMKPESAYYIKVNTRYNRTYRQPVCKSCVLAAESLRRKALRKPIPPSVKSQIIEVLATGPKSARQLSEAIGTTHSTARRRVKELHDEHQIRFAGYLVVPNNPHVPMWELNIITPAAPAERKSA